MNLKSKDNFAAMDGGMPRSASASRTGCAGARHQEDD